MSGNADSVAMIALQSASKSHERLDITPATGDLDYNVEFGWRQASIVISRRRWCIRGLSVQQSRETATQRCVAVYINSSVITDFDTKRIWIRSGISSYISIAIVVDSRNVRWRRCSRRSR